MILVNAACGVSPSAEALDSLNPGPLFLFLSADHFVKDLVHEWGCIITEAFLGSQSARPQCSWVLPRSRSLGCHPSRLAPLVETDPLFIGEVGYAGNEKEY